MTASAPSYSFTPDPALEALLSGLYRRFPPAGRGDMPLFEKLCAALGHPHLSLPPVFHVAGTNGKGSTLAFVQAVLETAGLRVHKYTSPHMVRFEERVVLCGRSVAADELAAALRHVAALAPEGMNFFSVLTAAAFVLFARHPADALLLETGVGGTLDPTNVVTPEVAMITRISFDHQHLLGRSLAAIASSKAGIIKPGRPAVTAPQPDPAVARVLAAAAQAAGVTLHPAGTVTARADGFDYHDGARHLRLPAPALAGAHQQVNAATALRAIGASRFAGLLDDGAAVGHAMQAVRWAGRMQRLTRGPLCALLGPHDELWLDGAHNDSGAEVLAAVLCGWRAADARPVHLLTGFKGKKDWQAFVAPLLPHVTSVSCLTPDLDVLTARILTHGDVLWNDMVRVFPPACYPAVAAGLGGVAPQDAVRRLLEDRAGRSIVGQRIVIAGSLYLAGHILRDHA